MVLPRPLMPHQTQDRQQRAAIGKFSRTALRERRTHRFRKSLHAAGNIRGFGELRGDRHKTLFRILCGKRSGRAGMACLGPLSSGFNDRQQSHQHILLLNAELRPSIKDITPRPRRDAFLKEESPRCRNAAFFTRGNVGITHQRIPAPLFKVIHRKKRRNACNAGWIAAPK